MNTAPHRIGLLVALAGLALGVSPEANPAGRQAYGGTLRMALSGVGDPFDPHQASAFPDRWMARWTQCTLFRVDGRGRVHPELAAEPGHWRGKAFVIPLMDGARFHDGTPIGATDVVRSLERLAQLQGLTSVGELLATLDVQAPDERTVVVRPSRPTKARTLRRLLARSEVAVLEEGRPGRGRSCGPFRVAGVKPTEIRLEPYAGHVRGRPWLDGAVVMVTDRPADEVAAMEFREVDVSRRPSRRYRRVRTSRIQGHATAVVVPHGRHRAEAGRPVRTALVEAARRARLAHRIGWKAQRADRLWPRSVDPSRGAKAGAGPLVMVDEMVLAYDSADQEAGELTRALRDSLSMVTGAPVRAVGVPGLRLAEAGDAPDSAPWDAIVGIHDWAALDGAQASAEAAWAFGLEGFEAGAALGGRSGSWAKAVVSDAQVIPLLHIERPILTRGPWRLTVTVTGAPDLAWSWRR